MPGRRKREFLLWAPGTVDCGGLERWGGPRNERVGSGWSGLVWAGLGWSGLGWAGLGWAVGVVGATAPQGLLEPGRHGSSDELPGPFSSEKFMTRGEPIHPPRPDAVWSLGMGRFRGPETGVASNDEKRLRDMVLRALTAAAVPRCATLPVCSGALPSGACSLPPPFFHWPGLPPGVGAPVEDVVNGSDGVGKQALGASPVTGTAGRTQGGFCTTRGAVKGEALLERPRRRHRTVPAMPSADRPIAGPI